MQQYLERALIVFNPDGTIKGASQQMLTVDPTGTFPSRQGDPQPIDAKDFAKLLPDKAALLAQVSALQKENAEMRVLIESIKRHMPREKKKEA